MNHKTPTIDDYLRRSTELAEIAQNRGIDTVRMTSEEIASALVSQDKDRAALNLWSK